MHQLAFDSNFFAFGEEFLADFRELAPRHDGVPLGVFYAFALIIGVGRIGKAAGLGLTPTLTAQL